jgi:hypothetical protein
MLEVHKRVDQFLLDTIETDVNIGGIVLDAATVLFETLRSLTVSDGGNSIPIRIRRSVDSFLALSLRFISDYF